METIGIDFAAQPRNTAAVVLEWGESGGHAPRGCVSERLTDDAIVDLLAAYPEARVGIDSPFGWPVEFVAAVTRWSRAGRWPGVETPELRLRLTDRFVHENVGKAPLSVSTDRIAVAAFRCARLLTRLADGGEVPRVGGRIVEVYPAAALYCWDLLPPQDSVLETLITRARLDLDQHVKDRCFASEHCLDALIGSLVARATYLGLTERPPADRRETIEQEGWIELPLPHSLPKLGTGVQPRTV